MARTNHLIEPEELMAYLDGELPLDRAAAASAHLEHCRECQAIAADVQGVSRHMLAWQVEAVDRPAIEDLHTALEAGPAEKSGKRARWPRPWILVAAGVSVIAVLLPVSPRLYKSK